MALIARLRLYLLSGKANSLRNSVPLLLLQIFDDSKIVFSVGKSVADIVHVFLDEEYPEAADLALGGGERDVRIFSGQRVVGQAGIREGDRDLRIVLAVADPYRDGA